jgi:acyl-CoA hydrolase
MAGSKKELLMAEIMRPDKVNFSGHVFGGYITYLLDNVAYACAVRYSGNYVVTAAIDEIIFKEPIFVGELVTFYANVNYVGRTSMEIGIKVTAENLQTREVRHTNSCYFTMVAVDDQGRPTPVPPLALETALDKRRYQEAQLRRALSEEMRQKRQEIKEKAAELHKQTG